MKSVLKNAGAHHHHQDLIDGNARAFIHRVQTVQKSDDLFFIKEWDRSQGGTSKCVLHQSAEFLLGI